MRAGGPWALLLLCGLGARSAGAAAPAAAAEPPKPPSCSSAEHRAFDFWLGEWEVRERGSDDGATPARSSIQSILGGCVVFENWSEDGQQGKSLNAWDPVRRAWKQTWMDDRGGIGEFIGHPFQNGLRFEGESHWPSRDRAVQRRITYLPLADGSVEQTSELSIDGATWRPFYDLVYRRSAPAAAPTPETRGAAATPRELSAADRTEVAAVLEAFRTGWLANDRARILGLFLERAVFLPHHGLEPLDGVPALTRFWFPEGAPPTPILEFVMTTDRLAGSGDFAYAWGHTTLAWRQQEGSGQVTVQTRGTHLAVLERSPAGWKIALLMSSDVPNERRPAN